MALEGLLGLSFPFYLCDIMVPTVATGCVLQMPPRSNIEVVGEPHVVDTPKGRVTVIPARINANLKAKTIEEIQAQRRGLHLSLVENVVREVRRDIREVQKSPAFSQRKAADPTKNKVQHMLSRIVKECEHTLEVHSAKEVEWFNNDHNYDKILGEAILLKTHAMGKLSYWMDNKEVWASDHYKRTLIECSRLKYGRALNRFWDVKDSGDTNSAKELAKHLCIEQGFITGELDEIDDHGETPLHAVAADGVVRAVRMLLHAGADVEMLDGGGNSPLMVSCRGGIFDCAQVLLDAKADPNVQNDDGCSAIILAAQSGHTRCIGKLLDAGVDVNEGGRGNGFTPLMWAAQNNQPACVDYLLQHGADPKVATREGWTALFDATMSAVLEPAKILIAAGADVNAKRASGAGPLFIACTFAAEDDSGTALVRLLLEAKADPDGDAAKDKVPLHEAAAKGRRSFVELLLQHGADVNAGSYRTAYEYADENDHEDVKMLLLAAEQCVSVDPRNLGEGTRVSCHYKLSKWYDARIVARDADGSYQVAWDDGDSNDTTGKNPQALRISVAQLDDEHLALLAPGDAVVGLYQPGGTWYPAKIREIAAGAVTLAWDDGDTAKTVKRGKDVRIALDVVLQKLSATS